MRKIIAGVFSMLFVLMPAQAEQKETLGKWDVHYIVLNTTFLQPEIAARYGIVRSKYNALVNISVLDSSTQEAQSLLVEGNARNLLGTEKSLSFKQVTDGDAIYYLAVLPFRNDETYRFNIDVADGQEKHQLTFSQKMYVD